MASDTKVKRHHIFLRHSNARVASWLSIDLSLFVFATLVSYFVFSYPLGDVVSVVLFFGSVIFIAILTKDYFNCVLSSSIASAITMFFINQDSGERNVIAWLFLLFVFMGISFLIVRSSNQSEEYRYEMTKQYQKEKLINDINQRLLTARATDSLELLTLESLCELTGKAGAIIVKEYDNLECSCMLPRWLIIYPTDLNAANECFNTGKNSGIGTDTNSSSSFLYVPIPVHGKVIAVAAIRFGIDNLPTEKILAEIELIISQASLAMTRQRLIDEQNKIKMEAEKEKIRNDFLRAISHDLRTPLAGIISACSTLRENDDVLSEKSKDELIMDVQSEAEWLLSMVENLLSVTKATGGADVIKKSVEPVDEIVWAAIKRTLVRYPAGKIRTEIPDEVLLAEMDATLIVQVLSNLIENALKYSQSAEAILVKVCKLESFVEFSVRDFGIGISEKALSSLFESKAIRNNSGNYGLGIGLSICKTIIESHKGTITGVNAPDGGALFKFTIPMEEIC